MNSLKLISTTAMNDRLGMNIIVTTNFNLLTTCWGVVWVLLIQCRTHEGYRIEHVNIIMYIYAFTFTGLLVSLSDADVYLHNPRGSNNRLNGARTARANNNRLFDSQVSFKITFHTVLRSHAINCTVIIIQLDSNKA